MYVLFPQSTGLQVADATEYLKSYLFTSYKVVRLSAIKVLPLGFTHVSAKISNSV